MPWNEPGSGKPSNNRANSGNEVEDMLKNLKSSFGGGKRGGNGGSNGGAPSWLTLPAVAIGLAAIVLFNSIYTVKEGQESVVLRFGEYLRTDTAGLNVAWWPIETKFQVETNKLRTVEVGYRGNDSQPNEALMLTNDENIIDVTMAIQYTIKDLKSLLFNVANVRERGVLDQVVRGATESALREVVGSKTMEELITTGRGVVDVNTKEILQIILDRYNTGIQVESVEIQVAKPPAQVRDAFDDVVKAKQDKIRKENDAQAYANDLIPRARGEATRLVQEAEGYQKTVVAEATGNAERFNQILVEYKKAPAITKKRLYLETMEEVLANTNKVMMGDNGGNSLMYLPIDKIIENNKASRASSSVSKQVTQLPQQQKTQLNAKPVRNLREGR